ncbi:DUF5318 family protein [Corynebacterium sp.]|uniref:DUF5318 family protein n=1 Tax=Corynebacterium sp. TaxID=1720 RepID=UPI003B3BD74E
MSTVHPVHTVSHDLDRQRTLRALRRGERRRADVCDADRGLSSSAEVLGTRVERVCPVCGAAALRESLWVHGAAIGEKSGTARSLSEIDAILATLFPDGVGQSATEQSGAGPAGGSGSGVAVHTVEVCLRCGWNHLIREDMYGLGNSSTERTAT